jgi:hypothetical protein
VTLLGRTEARNLRYSALHVTEISSVVFQSVLARVYTADKDMLRNALRTLKHNSDKEVAVLSGLQCSLLFLVPTTECWCSAFSLSQVVYLSFKSFQVCFEPEVLTIRVRKHTHTHTGPLRLPPHTQMVKITLSLYLCFNQHRAMQCSYFAALGALTRGIRRNVQLHAPVVLIIIHWL